MRRWFCPRVSRIEGSLTVAVLGAMTILDLGLGLRWQGLVIGALAVGALACVVRGTKAGRLR